MYILATIVIPRIYMMDWTNTPTELLDTYITVDSDKGINESFLLVGDEEGFEYSPSDDAYSGEPVSLGEEYEEEDVKE